MTEDLGLARLARQAIHQPSNATVLHNESGLSVAFCEGEKTELPFPRLAFHGSKLALYEIDSKDQAAHLQRTPWKATLKSFDQRPNLLPEDTAVSDYLSVSSVPQLGAGMRKAHLQLTTAAKGLCSRPQ